MDFILLFKYIILGIIQGFTEPLPISSSGHLVIMKEIFGVAKDLNFEIIVNFGSLFAIILFYFTDIKKLVTNSINYIKTKENIYFKDFKYLMLVLIATIPAGLMGLIFKDFIGTLSLFTVGLSLIITGLALRLVEKESTENKETCVSTKDALTIGFFQIIGLVPGISRSGSTLVGGLLRKIRLEETLKFSFLMYIPISFLSGLQSIYYLYSSTPDIFLLGYILGFIASFIATFYAIKWLIKMVKSKNLRYFAYYCFIVGISVTLYTLI